MKLYTEEEVIEAIRLTHSSNRRYLDWLENDIIQSLNKNNMKPHSFCETPHEKCTLNYCDENGCLNRKRELLHEDAICNLAELESEIQGWGKYEGLSEQNGIKEAYINGYNKAKENLYTKEQLMEVIELARLIDYNGSNDYYMSEDEIIKALKP